MNKKQKLILAIFVPVILFFIAVFVAKEVGGTFQWQASSFDLRYTWHVWLLYSASCCIFEYKLFEDKKRKIKN
ncbi:MAG: hypothetical protein KKC53_04760 [Actinobacteria bacterium]|nr:hypothetical protein [Actinomycetota bacterium]